MPKILAIDDKNDNLISLKAILNDIFSDAVVFTALTGEKGIELATAEDPDVILLDIVMPGMDGFEVCRRLKEDPILCDIPVIFLTALQESKKNRLHALEIGAEAFLSKPIDETELTAQIRAMLKIKSANELKRNEKERLAQLVSERTQELEQSQIATLKVLNDLKAENEARRKIEEKLRESDAIVRNKLKAITEPKGDIGTLELSDIIDTEVLQSMMDDFYKLTGMLGAILDISGKVLVAVGWQDICAKFHRCNPDTLKHCLESDTILTNDVPAGTFKAYHCKNNMWDMVTPIIIGDRHVGNVFIGQFFYNDEIPDVEIFRKQARQYGFDETEYLSALDRVPRFSKETVDNCMQFYARLAGIISTLSFSSIQQSRLLSEQKLAEEKLKESEKYYGKIISTIGDPVFVKDDQSRFLLVNDAFCNMLGLSRNEIINKTLTENLPPKEMKHFLKIDKQVLKDGKDNITEESLTVGDSKTLTVSTTKTRFINNDSKKFLVGVIHDVTEQKLVAQTLSESEERFRNAITYAPYPIMIHADGKVLQLSEEWIKQTGYTIDDIPTIKKWSLKAYGKDAVPNEEFIENLYKTDKTQYDGEWEVKMKDGSYRLWDFSSSPMGQLPNGKKMVISMASDITDRKQAEKEHERLQDQLRQAQKMESVGRLAGGVAHDYNNISSIIMGYSELALDKLEQSDPLYNDLMEILTAAKRSADVTQQLLAFARKQTIAPKVLDLNDIIGALLKMLRRLIGEDIDLAWIPGVEIRQIKIDPSQINQIMANLCVNARDAITDVGRVTVETKNIDLDENYCDDYEGAVPGEYIQLSVSDDGCGMTPETRDKIFEPFFTTKGVGKGTGLGLSTVYGIVKQNNGFVNVYSETEKGTTFRVYLPIHIGQTVNAHSGKTIEIPLSRGETVLLVEDDDSILKIVKRILEKLGYAVLCSSSPMEAISLAAEHADEINLLITDVVMPEMNGRELSDRLQSLYPNLKTLFMSGYTADIIAKRGVLEGGVSFIEKPFSKKELAVKVREVLGEGGRKIMNAEC